MVGQGLVILTLLISSEDDIKALREERTRDEERRNMIKNEQRNKINRNTNKNCKRGKNLIKREQRKKLYKGKKYDKEGGN